MWHIWKKWQYLKNCPKNMFKKVIQFLYWHIWKSHLNEIVAFLQTQKMYRTCKPYVWFFFFSSFKFKFKKLTIDQKYLKLFHPSNTIRLVDIFVAFLWQYSLIQVVSSKKVGHWRIYKSLEWVCSKNITISNFSDSFILKSGIVPLRHF